MRFITKPLQRFIPEFNRNCNCNRNSSWEYFWNYFRSIFHNISSGFSGDSPEFFQQFHLEFFQKISYKILPEKPFETVNSFFPGIFTSLLRGIVRVVSSGTQTSPQNLQILVDFFSEIYLSTLLVSLCFLILPAIPLERFSLILPGIIRGFLLQFSLVFSPSFISGVFSTVYFPISRILPRFFSDIGPGMLQAGEIVHGIPGFLSRIPQKFLPELNLKSSWSYLKSLPGPILKVTNQTPFGKIPNRYFLEFRQKFISKFFQRFLPKLIHIFFPESFQGCFSSGHHSMDYSRNCLQISPPKS